MSHSLKGLRVLNTRPIEQARELSKKIRNACGIAIELPTLEIRPIEDWFISLPELDTVDQAIFTSANAVEHCFIALQHQHIHWPPTIKITAIGKGSTARLHHFNVPVNTIPQNADSEHLLALPNLQQPKKQKILLFKGAGGRALIEDSLLKRGANLIAMDVYQRVLPKISPQFVKSIWRDDLVDIILLTSEQSMHHLFKLFEEEAHHWLRNKACLVISERLAQAAVLLGIKNIIRSHPDGMMDTLFDYVIKD